MKQKPELQLFQNDNFGTIRTVILDGEPWFVAKDVCDILGIPSIFAAAAKSVSCASR